MLVCTEVETREKRGREEEGKRVDNHAVTDLPFVSRLLPFCGLCGDK